MASITAMLSTLAVAAVIGWSVQHRPIELMHVTGSGPRVLVVGCIHGNECDPDGYDAHHRQNADGVDLNRSFPDGREPETRVAVASIRRLHPDVTIWFHPGGEPGARVGDVRGGRAPLRGACPACATRR